MAAVLGADDGAEPRHPLRPDDATRIDAAVADRAARAQPLRHRPRRPRRLPADAPTTRGSSTRRCAPPTIRTASRCGRSRASSSPTLTADLPEEMARKVLSGTPSGCSVSEALSRARVRARRRPDRRPRARREGGARGARRVGAERVDRARRSGRDARPRAARAEGVRARHRAQDRPRRGAARRSRHGELARRGRRHDARGSPSQGITPAGFLVEEQCDAGDGRRAHRRRRAARAVRPRGRARARRHHHRGARPRGGPHVPAAASTTRATLVDELPGRGRARRVPGRARARRATRSSQLLLALAGADGLAAQLGDELVGARVQPGAGHDRPARSRSTRASCCATHPPRAEPPPATDFTRAVRAARDRGRGRVDDAERLRQPRARRVPQRSAGTTTCTRCTPTRTRSTACPRSPTSARSPEPIDYLLVGGARDAVRRRRSAPPRGGCRSCT